MKKRKNEMMTRILKNEIRNISHPRVLTPQLPPAPGIKWTTRSDGLASG